MPNFVIPNSACNPTAPTNLLITLNYPPPMIGGSVAYLNQIFSNIPADELQVITVSKGNPKAEHEFDVLQTYRIKRLPLVFGYRNRLSLLDKVRFIFTWIFTLWKHVRSDLCDVVTLENIFLLGLPIRLFCNLRKVPYTVVCFGEELSQALESKPDIRGRIRTLIYGYTLRGATHVVSISHPTTALVTKFGVSPEQISEIFPPTPIPTCFPKEEQISGFRRTHNLDGKRVIASVGRLIRRKGHDKLLQAVPKVIERVPNVVLVIAGSGPIENELRSLTTQLGMAEHVRFLGRVETDELSMLYAACELFVMPNRTLSNGDQEGYGIVFNEANAYGKPVIGGNSGGTPEAIIDGVTGLLVNGDDVDAIAASTIRLLEDTDLARRMGQAGREWVEAERTPQHAAEQFLELVRTVSEKRDIK